MLRKYLIATIAIVSSVFFTTPASATHYYKSIAGMGYMQSVCLVINEESVRSYRLSAWEQDQWYSALQKTAQLYNNVFYYNSRVNFAAGGRGYSPSWCSSFVSYSFKSMSSTKDGLGKHPKNGEAPGNVIYINSNTRFDYSSIDLKTGLVAHELGHNIGLCHTNQGYCNAIDWTSSDHEANKSLFRAEGYGERQKSPTMTYMDRRVLRAMYK